ncbi:MAG: UDP-3-O-acyl-N-acetylglucosamine deacetylase [Alphaproteobacteria bacterium]
MLKHKFKAHENIPYDVQKLPRFLVAQKQKTIKNTIKISGIGLHTGNKVSMSINPAPINTGYIFRVLKNNGSTVSIKADYKNVKSTQLCTLLSDNIGNSISTVEHILSACYGLDIDNVYIDLNSNEVPVCDGSSIMFVKKLQELGYEEQSEFKDFFRIKKVIQVKDGDKVARVSPFDQTLITCDIDYDHKLIGKQSISLVLNPEIYKTQISSARTFGFLKDVKKLREMKLALGGSLKNAIVLDDNKVLNKEGLRFTDEFVRHKVLDFLGDISLSGKRILGSFYTSQSGHSLNIKLIEKIFENSDNWELVCSN